MFIEHTVGGGGLAHSAKLPVASRQATYDIKLYCANCGIKEFYTMPFGAEFMPFEGPHESTSGQREYSYVHVGGLKEEPGTDHDKNCRNCGLPFLCLEYWDANESPTKKQKVATNG